MVNIEKTSLVKSSGVSTISMNSPILEAVAKLAATNDREARGAIYTRVEVVEFILDLVGYKPDQKHPNALPKTGRIHLEKINPNGFFLVP